MNLAVDTDVVSYIFKQDTRAPFYQTHLLGLSAALSFMSVAELDNWALRQGWGRAKISRLGQLVSSFTIILPDRDQCRLWAEVTSACRRARRPIQSADAWIAAMAIQLGVPLLTNNRSDFAAVASLTVISSTP